MMDLSSLRIFICTTPTSMHAGIDRLAGLAQETFDQNPMSGHLFIFINRDRNRIKILYWDVDGFCVWYKRLEVGVYQLPVANPGEHGVELSSRQLNRLLGGFDLKNGRRRRRFRRIS
jgi:transposase